MTTLIAEPDYDELDDLFPVPPRDTKGGKCQQVRRKLGVTQKELAAAAGVTFKDVSDLENDRPGNGLARLKILLALNNLAHAACILLAEQEMEAR